MKEKNVNDDDTRKTGQSRQFPNKYYYGHVQGQLLGIINPLIQEGFPCINCGYMRRHFNPDFLDSESSLATSCGLMGGLNSPCAISRDARPCGLGESVFHPPGKRRDDVVEIKRVRVLVDGMSRESDGLLEESSSSSSGRGTICTGALSIDIRKQSAYAYENDKPFERREMFACT